MKLKRTTWGCDFGHEFTVEAGSYEDMLHEPLCPTCVRDARIAQVRADLADFPFIVVRVDKGVKDGEHSYKDEVRIARFRTDGTIALIREEKEAYVPKYEKDEKGRMVKKTIRVMIPEAAQAYVLPSQLEYDANLKAWKFPGVLKSNRL